MISEARSFGIWLGRLYFTQYGKDPGIKNWDYVNDTNGRGLRYRFICDDKFVKFVNENVKKIHNAGWHLTTLSQRSRSTWQIGFEKILTKRVAKGIFWHLTPIQNVFSVLEHGLIPRQSRFSINYPQPRIYLIRNKIDAEKMIKSFAVRETKPMEYALLRVDLTKATGIKLHIDPELKDVAVYTTQSIPANFILVKENLSHSGGMRPDAGI